MHTKILRRAGFVLITIGAIDIAYMIWCISTGNSYSSSFNIFALVGGVLLVRGGLKTARWVATGSSFMLAACGVVVLVMPFTLPLGYWVAVFKFGTGIGLSMAFAVALLALLFWLRQQMMHPSIREAQLAAGLPPPRTTLPIATGVALPVALITLLGFMFHSDAAHEAIRRAEQQLGGNYHYVITNMQMNSNTKETNVFAVVAAYNDTELKSVQLSWKQ